LGRQKRSYKQDSFLVLFVLLSEAYTTLRILNTFFLSSPNNIFYIVFPMKNASLLPSIPSQEGDCQAPPSPVSPAGELKSLDPSLWNSGVGRRRFLKTAGAATAGTTLALNGLVFEVLASQSNACPDGITGCPGNLKQRWVCTQGHVHYKNTHNHTTTITIQGVSYDIPLTNPGPSGWDPDSTSACYV
jgi:hypothetical protein